MDKIPLGDFGDFKLLYLINAHEDRSVFKVPEGVIKISASPREIENIAKLSPHPNLVEIFQTGKYAYSFEIDSTENGGETREIIYYIYVMKEYRGSIINEVSYTRKNLNKCMRNLLDGLQFIHSHNLVHGDIKHANILVERDNFVWCDFEALAKPDKKTPLMAGYKGYYYYSFGADEDIPYKTYLNDLQALMYIYWTVSLSGRSLYLFKWQKKAKYLYKIKSEENKYAELNELREAVPRPEKVMKYREIIQSVLPSRITCPMENVYDNLRELF